MDLYGLKYNNYFNRIIKKENDAIGYFNAATLKATQFNVSFNPNDGVTTTQIVNNGPEQHWEECDYVIITEKQTSSVNIQFVNALEDTVSETDKAKMIAIMIKHTTYNEALSRQILDIVDNSPYKTQFSCKTLPDAVQMFNEIKADDTLYNIYTGNIISGTSAINSRWFIIECQRTRSGQYSLQLKRDVIADNYDAVIDAPCYIERATIKDAADPYMYQGEPGINLNQIKSAEYLLKDITQTAWLVAYIDGGKTEEAGSTTIEKKEAYDIISNYNLKDKLETSGTIVPTDSGMLINQFTWQFDTNDAYLKNFESRHQSYYKQLSLTTRVKNNNNVVKLTIVFNKDYMVERVYFDEYYFEDLPFKLSFAHSTTDEELLEAIKTVVNGSSVVRGHIKDFVNDLQTSEGKIVDPDELKIILDYDGKVLYDHQLYQKSAHDQLRPDIYYNLKVKQADGKPKKTDYTTQSDLQYLYDLLVSDIPGTTAGTNVKIDARTTYSTAYISGEVSSETNAYDFTISATRCSVMNQPFDMLAIPLNIRVVTSGSSYFVQDENLAIATINAIQRQLGDACYDIQLLPYCPCMYMIDPAFDIGNVDYVPVVDLVKGTENVNYVRVKDGDTNLNCIIIYCNNNNGKLNIFSDYGWDESELTDPKLQDVTEFCRLISPNYNGIFEFSIAKNGGLDAIIAEYTYKPYNPYIHIHPQWGNLYGSEFGDARGLICGGDFSLPQQNDKWENYQINNKNYRNIFDLEINTMESQHKEDMLVDSISALGTAVNQGVSAGMKSGNATVGAVAGALSLGGGVADVLTQQNRYERQMKLKKDTFEMQLGNIKALPRSITNIGAGFNMNNKIWPFIEYYTCTDQEKEMLKQVFKYQGMSVNKIGTIRDYLQAEESYIRGSLIRVESINGNSHVAADIYQEIAKGVYI